MHTRRDFTLILGGLLAAGPVLAVEGEPLLWVGAEVPPFLSRGRGGPQGYAFDLYQRVSQQAGLAGEVRFYPWARAMQMLLAHQAHGSLVVGRSPEREARFHWLFPVGNFRFAIFTHADGGPAPTHVESLQGRRIGWLRASAGREMLTGAGVAHIVEGKDYPELLTLLHRGVVDAVVGPEPALRMLQADQPASAAPLRSTLLDSRLDVYTVAGVAMPAHIRHRLTTAYQQLVDNGVVAQLKKRHPDAFPDA